MSEIKDRQDAASDIDPIVAALADDSLAAAAVEGFDEAAEPVDAEPPAGADELPSHLADAAERSDDPFLAVAPDDGAAGELLPELSERALYPSIESGEPGAADFGDEAPATPMASTDIADAIEAALLEEASEPAASAFEQMPAAYADTIVELDAGASRADDETPLLDADLEDGIASVFAALHAAREGGAPVEPLGDLEAADGITFRLLGELDRLWHRAA